MENFLPYLADALLLFASIGAAGYCLILSRRLTRLNSIDKGLGGAIAVLSAQVDDLTKVLDEAKSGSDAAADRLAKLIAEAEGISDDIEEVLAASHDLGAEAGQFGSRRTNGPEDEAELSEPPMFRRRTVQEAAE